MINTLLCILLLTQPPATLPTGDALTNSLFETSTGNKL